MAWLFASVVFLTTVFLLIAYPAIRQAALVGVLLLAVVVVAGIGYQHKKDEAARKAITEDQIELADLGLEQKYGVWTVTGVVRNKSPHTLSGVTADLYLQECPSPKCEVIDQVDLIIFDRVPPGQARHFEHYVSLPADPPVGWGWSFRVKEIVADLK